MASKPQTARITPKGSRAGYSTILKTYDRAGTALSPERSRVKLGDHPLTMPLGKRGTREDDVSTHKARTNPHGAGTKKRKPTPKGRK